MLTVHHLGKSQSERIVWLCEELEISYDLKRYAREADAGAGGLQGPATSSIGERARRSISPTTNLLWQTS